jgi:hypothetical protein
VTDQASQFIQHAAHTIANNEMVTPLGFVPTGNLFKHNGGR